MKNDLPNLSTSKISFRNLAIFVTNNFNKIKDLYVKNITSPLEKTKYFNKKNRIRSMAISFWMCYFLLDIEFLEFFVKFAKHIYDEYAYLVVGSAITVWGLRKFIKKLSTIGYFTAYMILCFGFSLGISLIFCVIFGVLLRKLNLSWLYGSPHYVQVAAFFSMWFINLYVFAKVLNEYKRLFNWKWLKNHLENLCGVKKEK